MASGLKYDVMIGVMDAWYGISACPLRRLRDVWVPRQARRDAAQQMGQW
jgi:hypothetical protein